MFLHKKKIIVKKKSNNIQTGRFTDFFSGLNLVFTFFPGSLAGRFCTPTEPDLGLVPDSTGRSGYDNLALYYT
jgi:hypothetical protein